MVSTVQLEDSTAFESVFVPFGALRFDGQNRTLESLRRHQFRSLPRDRSAEHPERGTKQRAQKQSVADPRKFRRALHRMLLVWHGIPKQGN